MARGVRPTVDVTGLPPDRLGKEGWERRSILDEPRLSEAVEIYRALGLEVMVVDLDAATADECASCLESSLDNYKVVYTRQGGAAPPEEGLFD